MKKELIEKGLSEIDFYFGEALSEREEVVFFLAVLLFFSRQGHICVKVTEEEIIPSLSLFEEYEEPLKEKILKALPYLEGLPIHSFNNRFYLLRNWNHETLFIEHVKRLVFQDVERIECSLEDPSLAPEQKAAIDKALTLPLSIITGGPGTGKTYTAAKLVEAFLASSKEARIILTAPTGKAAARLEESLGKYVEGSFKAQTLHSLLGIYTNLDFERKSTLIYADLIIVDECSMIDARLFSFFLASLKKGTRLVLMGDPFQLPSVEAGSFFADLMEAFPSLSTCLKLNFRSEQDSIKELGRALLEKGEEEVLKQIEKFSSQEKFSFENLLAYVKKYCPLPSKEKPEEEMLLKDLEAFRILSSMRKGPLGVDALNKKIASTLFSEMRTGEFLALPILIIKNNYELGLYNGQSGIVVRKKREGKMDLYSFDEEDMAFFPGGKTFKCALLPFFEYAYAISVHKSQGSEYDRVLLLIPPGSEVFGKEVLYTAVTRAKKHLEIEARVSIIQAALKKIPLRGSGFKERILL